MTDEQVLTGFFAACSVICWLNIRALIIDKKVCGVCTIPTWVFLSTNLYEVYFFFHHGQTFAMIGSVGMSLANSTWLTLYWVYKLACIAEERIAEFP